LRIRVSGVTVQDEEESPADSKEKGQCE
jgi:hypothetical protein